MSRPKRKLVIAGVVLLLVAAEVGLRTLNPPSACVMVVNPGAEPMEGLVLTSGGSRDTVARIAPGESAKLSLNGRRDQLKLAFRQRGNAITSIALPDFDPARLRREGSRLVLVVRTNEFERYQEEDDPSLLRRRAEGTWGSIERWLNSLAH